MNLCHDPDGIRAVLSALDRPCYVTRSGHRVGVTAQAPAPGDTVLAAVGPLPPDRLGSAAFRDHHGVRAAYMAGAMAGGIAGTELVTAMARAGYLAAFGSAGLPGPRLDEALRTLAHRLGDAPYACNLIHSPMAPHAERACVDLCLRHGVRCVEASAFLTLTPDLVRYRASGLRPGPAGGVLVHHRVIAKVSRPQVAELFLRPAPEPLLTELVARREITAEQARLARAVPMADDLTVEADSGGHTDRRPLTVLLPAITRLRDRIARETSAHRPPRPPVRVGAAGSLGTPHAVAAAFALGADYVVTGSVNQAAVEAATSPAVKSLLADAGLADCTMAPAADMFEQGITVQVLNRGTLFPGRAGRLYRLYRDYGSLEELPAKERRSLEERIFGRPLDEVWADTRDYLAAHHADRLPRAERDAKHRMALTFRWYLAMASRWAVAGDTARSGDWQIWCGPAMGAFNAWAAGSTLEPVENRHVTAIAEHLLRGAAHLTRVHHLRTGGTQLPASCADYRPPRLSPAARSARRDAPGPAAPPLRIPGPHRAAELGVTGRTSPGTT
ncbi:PfaD family polyunsaturated fatty acid/polyketide biosynthesis protein [Streptomyces sp. NPDC050161]|uniref:PfaD family polyunsaturated fatty acid/polyketide biosynthesis protein n=1 Tax=Streptomyces sp. NPDC050161 TaxID=3365604 RepID=UPI00378C2D36